jgi:hypothetical protein
MALTEWLDERSVRAEGLPDAKLRTPKSGLKAVGSPSYLCIRFFFVPTWSGDAVRS